MPQPFTSRRNFSFTPPGRSGFVSNNFGDAPIVVVPGGSAVPLIAGRQFAGDTQSIVAGEITNITNVEWLTSTDDGATWTSAATGNTWPVPMVMGADEMIYRADVTGDLDGVTGVHSSPTKAVYKMDHGSDHTHDATEHMAMENAALDLVDHGRATLVFNGNGLASDPANYAQNRLPAEADVVLIARGSSVIWDIEACPRLHRVRVDGQFRVDTSENKHTHMLVETVLIDRFGDWQIGDSEANPMPVSSSFNLEFSTRDVINSPGEVSELDLADDPQLMGRGLISLGRHHVYGAAVTPMVWTAPNSLPVIGDTEVALDSVPINWKAGDEYVVPTTAFAAETDGPIGRMTEYRGGSVSGTTLTLDAPLIYRHDMWEETWIDGQGVTNNSHPAPLRDTEKNKIRILNMSRNVVYRTENGTDNMPSYLRAHCMYMHSYLDVATYYLGVKHCGRTDKTIPNGRIVNGEFYTHDNADNFITVPLTAQSNINGRYAQHFHQTPRDMGPLNRNRIVGCAIERSPGHAAVYHGCDADLINSTAVKCSGTAFVWEDGTETGWNIDNFAADAIHLGRKNSYAGLKGTLNRVGDRYHQPAGFAFGGRAMVTDNVGGAGLQFVVAQNNRYADGIAQLFPLPRIFSKIPRLFVFDRSTSDGFDVLRRPQFPFNLRNVYGIGCYTVITVLKSSGVNNHDFQSVFENTQAIGCHRGIAYNYLGIYLSINARMVCSGFVFNHPDNPFPNIHRSITKKGIAGGRIEAVRDIDSDIQGFDVGVNYDGGSLTQAINDDFSKLNPRFVIANPALISGNGTDIILATEGPQTPTADVSVVGDTNGYQELEMDAPFRLGLFGAGDFSNLSEQVFTGTKKDSFNLMAEPAAIAAVSPFPYEDPDHIWDHRGFPGSFDHIDVRQYGEYAGYHTEEGTGKKFILFWFHNSHVLEDRFQIQAHGIEIAPEYDVSNWTDNGTFIHSGIKPDANDITVTVTQGVPASFDVLALSAASTTAPGATLSLMDEELREPHRCTFHIDTATGILTLYPFEHCEVIPDKMQVTITDGQLGYRTIVVNINVSEAP